MSRIITSLGNAIPRTVLLVAFGAISMTGLASLTARADWGDSNGSAIEAAKRGDLGRAKSCFASAIRDAGAAGHSEQAALSTIGLANALTHEQKHAEAAQVLTVAVKLCDVQGAVTAPVARALRDSLAAAKGGKGNLNDIELRTAGELSQPGARADASDAGRVAGAGRVDESDAGRVAKKARVDESDAGRVAGAGRVDASGAGRVAGAGRVDASDAGRVAGAGRVDASDAGRVAGAGRVDAGGAGALAGAGRAPTPDASARSYVTAPAIGAAGAGWRPAGASGAGGVAPTPDASARSILQELSNAAERAR